MNAKQSQLRRAAWFTPWLTAVALVVLSIALPNRAAISADSIAHKARVADSISSVPFFIAGGWVGQDAKDRIPRQAQELLKPNAILSRSYSAPDRPMVHVLIVHCGDARDMIGHYPPICYPSSGWIEQAIPSPDHQVRVGDQSVTLKEYVFSRPRDQFVEDSIRVLNAFVLPDGRVTPRIQDINQQSERLALTVQGVAQLQFIMLANVPLDQSLQAAGELLAGMEGVLDALHVKKEEPGESQSPIL